MTVQLEDVTIKFGKTIALEEVNFRIESSETCCILGRNSSGKSTLLKAIAGGIIPTYGCVEIGNMIYNSESRKLIQKDTGILFDKPIQYTHLTVAENISLVASIYGVTKKEYLEEVLNLLSLSDFRDKRVGEISSGIKQRMGLAMAIVHRPSLLLLDEPTNALDTQSVYELSNVLNMMVEQYGTTIIYATHELNQISTIAQRYMILKQGKVIYDSKVKPVTDYKILSIDIKYHAFIISLKLPYRLLVDRLLVLVDRQQSVEIAFDYVDKSFVSIEDLYLILSDSTVYV